MHMNLQDFAFSLVLPDESVPSLCREEDTDTSVDIQNSEVSLDEPVQLNAECMHEITVIQDQVEGAYYNIDAT